MAEQSHHNIMSSSSSPSRSSSAFSKNGSTHTPVPQSTKDSSSPNSESKITATPKQSSTSNSGGKSMTMTSSFQTPKKTAASLPPLVSSSMTPLYEDETRQYYKSIELMMTPPAAKKWDAFGNNNNNDGIGSSCSDLKKKKGSSKWTVRVGDLACLQIEPPTNDHHCSNHNDDTPKTTAYYYQPIQILSIYQERQKNKLSTSDRKKRKRYTKDVFVEVRYFYRRGDLDERNQRCYYHSNDGEKEEEVEEEVLESDRVEVVHASFLLGRLVLNNNTSHCSNNNRLSSAAAAAAKATADNDDDDNDGENASVPTVTMNYNHRLYLHQEKDVLQFNPLEDDTTTTATTTTDALLIRGIQSSHIMGKDDKVKMATCSYLNLNMFGNSIIEEEGDDDVEQVVTLPPPTLTLQQPKVDMSSSSSPTTKKVSPNKRSPKQHRPLPSLNNHENSSSITTTTLYYPSCQIQFPASPTIHPYESPPITWNVCVGDVVAVHCMDGIAPIGVDKRGNNDDDGSSSSSTTFTEWYPYREPWAHAQITAIYRHVVVDDTTATTSNNSGEDTSTTTTTTTVSARKVQYDLRWFPRISESLDICQDKPVLSKRLLEIASDTSRTCEEILEGNHEEVGFTFLTLLGPILIDDDGTKKVPASSSSIAAAAAAGSKTQFATQNRRTINSTIYCDKLSQPKQLSPQKRGITTSGSSTIDGLVDRGIEASRLWMSRHSQRKVYREAVLQSRKERHDGIVTMDDNHVSESASIPSQKSPDSWSQKQTLFNESPAVAVAAAAAAAPTTTPKERRGKRGKAPVVAKAESEPKAKKLKQTNHDGVAADDNHVTVSASISCQKSPAEPAQKQTLFSQSPTTPAAAPTTTTTTKERRSKRGKAPVANAEPAPEPKKHKKQLTTSRKKELTSPQKEDTEDDVVPPRVIKCTKQPFHVDVSSQKSFYDEIEIQPPFDSYDDRFSSANKHDNNKQLLWKVRLGDMVCINVEEQHQKADLVTFPFAVTWSPAEIVSIYRVHSNKAECLELREKLQSGDRHLNDGDNDTLDVMVEVRWFYRKHEIPGAGSKSSKSQSDIGDELEEIFETDQINSCAAECLLSPVKLYEVSRPEESLPSVVSGMPCIHYQCRRYWSIHRKSFVPSGLLSNRVERGRMHSEYKAALGKLPSTSARNGKKASEGYSWKEGFQSAIQKLSLAEAAADVQVHGMELRCRERERQHIGSFLRKAIRGLEQRTNNSQDDDSVMRDDEGPMNTKSSIFICGPPGTGKTASVRSIINELQEEQASGNLPEFNFIALNGMEMRSPFDSYVKFWEALSGTRKERLSAGAAAAKLEEYFGDGERDESNEDRSKKPITVLMLDEIDYLVTKKQTILYNFFDWPLRATNARLIVIGISNTINLPERLSLKLQSRLGGERCHFKSYTVDETVAILKTRLDGEASEVFDEDAIKFASRKTGNLSGDIRKAFHMCKVAAQNAFDDYASGRRRIVEGSHPRVKISDVQRGSRDMYTSIIHKAISCSSSYEALVLIAIGALKKAKVGKDIVSLDVQEMLTKIESIANGSGEERYLSARLSLGDLLGILSRLGDAGILTLTTPKHSNHPWPLIQTSLEPYEINSSYRNTSHSKLAEKHLAEQRLF